MSFHILIIPFFSQVAHIHNSPFKWPHMHHHVSCHRCRIIHQKCRLQSLLFLSVRTCCGWCGWHQNASLLPIWGHCQHSITDGINKWRYNELDKLPFIQLMELLVSQNFTFNLTWFLNCATLLLSLLILIKRLSAVLELASLAVQNYTVELCCLFYYCANLDCHSGVNTMEGGHCPHQAPHLLL